MINHIRTLLLNVDGDGFGGNLGDQYIPPTYKALPLPTMIAKMRLYLFGATPDRVMLNYRVQQFLAMLRTTPLQEFVTILDRRITYDIDDPTFFSPANFATVVTPAAGTWITGAASLPDVTGICARSWQVTEAGDTVEVLSAVPPKLNIQPLTFTNGLSSLISLPGSNLSFRFQQGNASQWQISVVARPQQSLGSIEASLRQIGSPNIYQLFGVGTPRAQIEPWTTFYNLWTQHPELPYSLGGLVMAMAFYTEMILLGTAQ